MPIQATRWVCRQARIAAAIVAVAVLVPGIGAAQMSDQPRGVWQTRWAGNPTVAVLGRADDPRVPLVREAVDYWNRTFAEIGSPFRLGAITVVAGAVPAEQLQALSTSVLNGARVLDLPPEIGAVSGNIVVALSDGDFVSFARR